MMVITSWLWHKLTTFLCSMVGWVSRKQSRKRTISQSSSTAEHRDGPLRKAKKGIHTL